MPGLKNLPMKPKLIGLFLLVGLAPMAIVGWMSVQRANDLLIRKSHAQLTSIRDIQKASIEQYFKQINDQILTFSEDAMIVDVVRPLIAAFDSARAEQDLSDADVAEMKRKLATYYTGEFSEEYRAQNNGRSPDVQALLDRLDDRAVVQQYAFIRANENPLGSKHKLDDPGNGTTYARLHAKLHPILRSYLEKFGYYDIFLVDPDSGAIVYTVFKELDFSTSLKTGAYRDTGIGAAFRRALEAGTRDAVALDDYKPYLPSYEAPAGFIASPVFADGRLAAVAIFQLPLDRINAVMSLRSGLSKAGETYLVGPDKLMRSDSYLDPAHHSVRASFAAPGTGSVDTEACSKALAGRSGLEMLTGYTGNRVLSAYTPVQAGALTWALMADEAEDEILAPVKALRSTILWIVLVTALCIAAISLPTALSITGPLRKAMNYALAVARGDLGQELEVRQRDEIGVLADAMRSIPETLSGLLADVHAASAAIGRGRLRERLDGKGVQGAYAEMVGEINGFADSLVGLMDNIPTPIMAIDTNYEVLFMNRTGASMGGLQSSDLEGRRKCFDFFKTGDCRTRRCACSRTMSSHRREESETDAHPGGANLEIKYNSVPILGPDGSLQGVFEVVMDQTETVTRNRTMLRLADEASTISQDLSTASEALGTQVAESSRGAELQKERASETASAMEQMNATVLEVARNSSQAAEAAGQTRQYAQEGAEVMRGMLDATRRMQELMHALKASMGALGEHADNIGTIMNVINDIADQTNLLALNAAIEAARAGEAGRGFAVVADEVRKLAEKTVGATKQVGEAIQEIQTGARANIEETDRAVAMVADSASLAQGAEKALREILAMTDTTADQVRAIATAAEEQSSASEHVTLSSEEIHRISGETLAAMVQSSQAVRELTELSAKLNGLIEQLQS
ncbi:MAG: PAS domain-containing protein [Desulfovibrionaceae bacterium]|jgi:methyl-accepting chemotaxis protein|nr:PAS domain-containing protein [Desulfovibrionaceae bacterium]